MGDPNRPPLHPTLVLAEKPETHPRPPHLAAEEIVFLAQHKDVRSSGHAHHLAREPPTTASALRADYPPVRDGPLAPSFWPASTRPADVLAPTTPAYARVKGQAVPASPPADWRSASFLSARSRHAGALASNASSHGRPGRAAPLRIARKGRIAAATTPPYDHRSERRELTNTVSPASRLDALRRVAVTSCRSHHRPGKL